MKDTKEITRNIGLAFDLLDEVINNPTLADAIPSGSVVHFWGTNSEETQQVFF